MGQRISNPRAFIAPVRTIYFAELGFGRLTGQPRFHLGHLYFGVDPLSSQLTGSLHDATLPRFRVKADLPALGNTKISPQCLKMRPAGHHLGFNCKLGDHSSE